MHIRRKIDHFVVLMYENRSFDHLLGTLEHPGFGSIQFDGIPKDWQLPSNSEGGDLVPVKVATKDVRGSGPSHHHVSILRQLVGPEKDWKTTYGKKEHWKKVKPRWKKLVAEGKTNRGFVWDYRKFEKAKKYERLMWTWSSKHIPTIWDLALNYGICQRWFSSLPGMTQPNRLFSLCGHSFGRVDNRKPLTVAGEGETVFAHLDDWLFFGDPPALTPLIAKDVRKRSRWHPMSSFLNRAKHGELPAFSYLEPSNFLPAESQHPGYGGTGSVKRGDSLLARVYNALRSHPEKWKRTLLVVTWDEHGGFPDHVVPEDATPPGVGDPAHSKGFDFTIFGARVPCLVVSPWIPQGCLDMEIRDHTSILATMRELYEIPQRFFTSRVKSVPSLSSMLLNRLPDEDSRGLLPYDEGPPPAAEQDVALDPYQLEIALAMIDVAEQAGFDLGELADLHPHHWHTDDLWDATRALAPLLGAPELPSED